MTNRLSDRETAEKTTPRWVKVFAIVAIVVILVVVILHLTGHAPSHGL